MARKPRPRLPRACDNCGAVTTSNLHAIWLETAALDDMQDRMDGVPGYFVDARLVGEQERAMAEPGEPNANDRARAREIAEGCTHQERLRRGLGACEGCISDALAHERARAAKKVDAEKTVATNEQHHKLASLLECLSATIRAGDAT